LGGKGPSRIINARAPIRICDNGGWTDTWFAERGEIFNIAVSPYVEVQIAVYPAGEQRGQVVIHAENYGERYVRRLGQPAWDRHPLLEAAFERMHVPRDANLACSIYSEAPAGASTGTSAAVSVAMVGALDRLTPGHLSPHQVAYTAHSIETEMLKQQSGIQDQLCSAYGGINYIEMFQYPRALVSQIRVPDAIWWELERRLALLYLGSSHDSSQVHERVIRHLEAAGPEAQQLRALRATAAPSRDALYAGDFVALGQAMIANTEAQRALHPELVSAEAQQVIQAARAYGAAGWKVNGAGGEGGSLTLLCGPSSEEKRAMIREIEAENPRFQAIPLRLSRSGLAVWEVSPQSSDTALARAPNVH
jgi:D-glycero-alpha-D-manno-heptose-7-phosphate kinase